MPRRGDGTRPWHVFGEGPTQAPKTQFRERDYQPFSAQDVRFTVKGDNLYAIFLGWPEGGCVIRSLGIGSAVPADRIAGVSMLGADQPLRWSQDETGLRIELPTAKACHHAHVLRIALKRG